MAYEFKLPDVGEGLHEAEIVRWFVKEGDSIKNDERIAEIQTDKAVVEITSPVGGKILSLAGKEGDVVKVGETFITIEQEGQRKEPQEKEKRHENEQPLDNERTNKPAKKRVIAAPVVRKRARELGIDITEVTGSEKGGRITMADLENHLNQHNTQNEKKADSKKSVSPPQQTFVEGNDERVPVKGLRKKIADKMVKSKFTAPHVSSFSEFDVTKLVRLRKELIDQIDPGIKLTYLPFIIKAVTKALKEHPYFNAAFDDDHNEIILKKRYNIGIATATKQGLYVPVIKHADQKSILEIAMEIEQLSQKAHEQKLELSDMQDGTFTITSTGGGSGWFATPIINYPEVAIFGAHAIKKRPVVIDDDIVIREMMGVSLTFDHRVIDGEPAGRFMKTIEDILENPERLLLDVR